MKYAVYILIVCFSIVISSCNAQKITLDNNKILFKKELYQYLQQEKDTIFVCSRHNLKKVKWTTLKENYIKFQKTSKRDSFLLLELKLSNFVPSSHKLELVKKSSESNTLIVKNLIDEKYAYGIDGSIPKTELTEFRFMLNGKEIPVDSSIINSFYNINIDKTEVYFFKDKIQYLFLYLKGGDAAGAYSCKLVLSEKGLVTKIITPHCGYDFIDLIKYDCF